MVVTIIVLLILAGVATYSGIEAIENSKYTKFSAELKIMQTYVNQWYDDLKDKEGDFADNIDKKLGKVTGGAGASNTHDSDNTAQAALDAAGIDSSKYSHFYLLDDSVKEKLGVEGVTQEILVSIQDRTVVSYRGLNFKGNMYYTLEDIGEMYNVDYENPNTNSPIIAVTGRSVYYGNTAKNAKYKFTVDISQSSDYISKGDVYYGKLKDGIVENWYHTDEDNFTVDREENGTYQIYYKDAAGNMSNTIEYVIEPKATLITGIDFNVKMKSLAGDNSPGYRTANTNIKKFKFSLEKPSNTVLEDNDQKVSLSTSQYPVYMWFDTDTIYIWSEENWIALNTNAWHLFARLQNLEQIEELYKFDTSKSTSMAYMFYDCTKLAELNLTSFNTSNVTNMDTMFNGCGANYLDLSNFDTSNVENFLSMFYSCKNLTDLDLSNWNTSSATNMKEMFYNCYNLKSINLSSFNTSKVTTMESMFFHCESLTDLDLSSFDTSNVISMAGIFYACSSLSKLDLRHFNTSKVTNMGTMFYLDSNLTELDVSNFDTSKVTAMNNMFQGCSKLTKLDVSNFNTNNVTTMRAMFLNCTKLKELDLKNFDTNKVTSMYYMFCACSDLTTIYATNNFKTTAVTDSTNMFYGDKKLVGGSGTTYDENHIELDYAHIDGGTSNPGYFTSKDTI